MANAIEKLKNLLKPILFQPNAVNDNYHDYLDEALLDLTYSRALIMFLENEDAENSTTMDQFAGRFTRLMQSQNGLRALAQTKITFSSGDSLNRDLFIRCALSRSVHTTDQDSSYVNDVLNKPFSAQYLIDLWDKVIAKKGLESEDIYVGYQENVNNMRSVNIPPEIKSLIKNIDTFLLQKR